MLGLCVDNGIKSTLTGQNFNGADMIRSYLSGDHIHLLVSVLNVYRSQKKGKREKKNKLVCSSDVSQGISFLFAICGARYCDNRVNGAETEPMSLFTGPAAPVNSGRTR